MKKVIIHIAALFVVALALIGCCVRVAGKKVCVAPEPTTTPAPSPRPTPSATTPTDPSATPTATTPGPTATSTPVPTPTTGVWVTKLIRVNGFNGAPGGCNASRGPGRTHCHGDRTFHFLMPGFDLVPQYAGMGCEFGPDGLAHHPAGWKWGDAVCGQFDGRPACVCRDDAQSPCGGSPSCDSDHMSCERVRVGCNGRSWDDPRGSILKATGQIQCTEAPDHYGFDCDGTPNTSYMLCARPYADAHTEDGTPILVQGTGEFCMAGTF